MFRNSRFTATILVVLSFATTAMAEKITMPSRYYDEGGKLVCETTDHKAAKSQKCEWDDPRVVVQTGQTDVQAEHLEQYNQLEQAFVREAVRQYQLSRKMTPEQYYENLQKAEFSDWRCWFNGLLTCKLGEIAAQRNALGYDTGWGWFLKGGYVNRNIETPLQAERFGPYKGKAKRKLARLQKEFAVECIRQQIEPESAAESRKLLGTALVASSVMVRNLPPGKRQPLFDEWYSQCSKKGEEPNDATIRFLLSSQIRQFHTTRGNRGGKGVWQCHNSSRLLTTNECGTFLFWHSEERRLDITPTLRGLVPALPEAKQASK